MPDDDQRDQHRKQQANNELALDQDARRQQQVEHGGGPSHSARPGASVPQAEGEQYVQSGDRRDERASRERHHPDDRQKHDSSPHEITADLEPAHGAQNAEGGLRDGKNRDYFRVESAAHERLLFFRHVLDTVAGRPLYFNSSSAASPNSRREWRTTIEKRWGRVSSSSLSTASPERRRSRRTRGFSHLDSIPPRRRPSIARTGRCRDRRRTRFYCRSPGGFRAGLLG